MKDWVKVIVDTPLVRQLERLVPQYSLVGDAVFFTPDQFPWSQDLEANWRVIRQELEQVLEHVGELPNFQDIMPRQRRISPDDGWKTYYFCAFGFVAQKNCDRCPETWKLLQKIPGLKVAFFSILSPAILFLDIARPLKFPLSLVNWIVSQILAFSPLAQEAKANYHAWENRYP